MITLTREEAQKLLDGFERVGWARTEHADILRARLSAPEPEPVAWIYEDDEGRMMFSQMPTGGLFWEPVYRKNKGTK